MHIPTVEILGSTQYEPKEIRNYDLDSVELYGGPSDWQLDRSAVFAWARASISWWGPVRPIPDELQTPNVRCSFCEYIPFHPRPLAEYASWRDLYCPRHYRRWKRELAKLPKSPRRLAREEAEAWSAREWHCSWHDIHTPEQYLDDIEAEE